MSFSNVISLLCAGAFVAFALVYYGLVKDVGVGAYYALGIIAGVWIVELSSRRSREKKNSRGEA